MEVHGPQMRKGGFIPHDPPTWSSPLVSSVLQCCRGRPLNTGPSRDDPTRKFSVAKQLYSDPLRQSPRYRLAGVCSVGWSCQRHYLSALTRFSRPLGHYGPVMNYMARCQGLVLPTRETSELLGLRQCLFVSYLTVGQLRWHAQVQQESYSNAPSRLGNTHEILALHGATNIGGAQLYPVCVQLTVTGSGTKTSSGLAFPGAYSATDPDIHFSPYQGDAANKMRRTLLQEGLCI
ncbi:unnamed protein product [Somion occarium]|uniref:lytic cellulose monooxygenase (C4-dehydrogenating) n=1 Tax=Somion occarium TaxID=3059160 RepID=A0ABP1D7Q3_9APHY